ncbi:MAG TPA: hypothetical protein VGV61_07160 [Thermoanaerobaculia bacterium]|jgi:hypothetical protein|nr:hypothetical protein [Thermoanaerobaculia bacterium]
MQEADDAERERVAAVLEQLRAGVRQRRAELATLGSLSREGPLSTDGGDSGVEMQGRLLALRQSEYVREPVPTSHRQGLGRWIVLVKKAGYQLFGKWLVRPLLEQQNAFNQATSVALQELAENEERLARQVRELQAQLVALRGAGERRPGAGGA